MGLRSVRGDSSPRRPVLPVLVSRCSVGPRSRRPIRRRAGSRRRSTRWSRGPASSRPSGGSRCRSLASGRTLYALNPAKAFRPASTLKLVTTAAALDAFGPDARLRTTLQTAGRLDGLRPHPGRRVPRGRRRPQSLGPLLAGPPDGRVRGDGGGARRGGSAGASRAAWSGTRAPSWATAAAPPGPGRTCLGLRDRGLGALVRRQPRRGVARAGRARGRPGAADPRSGRGLPERRLLGHHRGPRASVAGQAPDDTDDGREITLLREPGSNDVRITGRLPIGGKWKGRLAVADPASCAAAVFASVLEARGIRVVGGVATSSAPLARRGARARGLRRRADGAGDPGRQQGEPEPPRRDAAAARWGRSSRARAAWSRGARRSPRS